jgi:hypothetical protein
MTMDTKASLAPGRTIRPVSTPRDVWAAALADFQAKRAIVAALPAGSDDEDNCVAAENAAIDYLIEKVRAPDTAAMRFKSELIAERFDGFESPAEVFEALVADAIHLGEVAAHAKGLGGSRSQWERAVAACHASKAEHLAAVRTSEGLHPSDAAEAALTRYDADLRSMVALPAPDLAALAETLRLVRAKSLEQEPETMVALEADAERLAAGGKMVEAEAWHELLSEYRALRALKVADEKYGPLFSANFEHQIAREAAEADPSDDARCRVSAAYQANEAALEVHMARYWAPWLNAGIALVRAPAPDLEAVDVKLMVIDEAGLEEREDEPGELFRIVADDVQRLAGIRA